jgi:hypothetical protein
LGGAVPGTPLPGQAPPQPISNAVIPSAYAGYPTTPYPVVPAYGGGVYPTTTAGNDTLGPLPRYGERSRNLR